MQHLYLQIEMRNPLRRDLPAIHKYALVDTGATRLYIPARIAEQLELADDPKSPKQSVVLAHGQKMHARHVGPVEIAVGGKTCRVNALVLGSDVLLGTEPMHEMDLVINLKKWQIKACGCKLPVAVR